MPTDAGPDTSRPLRRALRTPVVKATAMAGLFLGAAAALCVGPSAKQMTLLLFSVGVPCGTVIVLKGDAKDRRMEYPALRNVVIDKAGRSPPDANLLRAADDCYRRDVESAPRFFLTAPPLLARL